MNTIEESLKEAIESCLEYLERLDREVRAKELQNKQWFINLQDKLNALSIK